MAVYVMLVIENDNLAHKFVKEVLENGAATASTTGEDISNLSTHIAPTYVRGVWKKPTVYCDCPSQKRVDGFARGKKYGWWVHAGCGKPSKLWAKGDSWHGSHGRNLLPQSQLAPEYRSPENTQHPLWADLEPLLNPDGPVEFVNDDIAERVQRMVSKGASSLGPMHQGIVRTNEI